MLWLQLTATHWDTLSQLQMLQSHAVGKSSLEMVHQICRLAHNSCTVHFSLHDMTCNKLIWTAGVAINIKGEIWIAGSHISALHALVCFMSGLTNADADGRVILDTTACSLKFVLLNAAAHFSKVHTSQRSSDRMLYAQRVVLGPNDPLNPVDERMLVCLLWAALPAVTASPLLFNIATYGAQNEQQMWHHEVNLRQLFNTATYSPVVPSLKAAVQYEVHLNLHKSCSIQFSTPHPRCDL